MAKYEDVIKVVKQLDVEVNEDNLSKVATYLEENNIGEIESIKGLEVFHLVALSNLVHKHEDNLEFFHAEEEDIPAYAKEVPQSVTNFVKDSAGKVKEKVAEINSDEVKEEAKKLAETTKKEAKVVAEKGKQAATKTVEKAKTVKDGAITKIEGIDTEKVMENTGKLVEGFKKFCAKGKSKK